MPAAVVAAQRATDVETWMRLQSRLADIDAEIHAAEVAVVRVDLEVAWLAAETAHDHERARAAELEDLQAQVVAANENLTSTIAPTAEAVVARRTAMDRLRLAAEAARLAWRAARDVEGHALVEVERLERLVEDLTGELLPEGTGLRARPRPLAQGVCVGDDLAGAQAGEVDDFGSSVRVLEAGSIPPRWLAGRLGAHLYAPAPKVTWPEPPPVVENASYTRHVDDYARHLGAPASAPWLTGNRSNPGWLERWDG